MPYKVAIRRNSDGQIHIYEVKSLNWFDPEAPARGLEPGEGSEFWWTEGNCACDCNRHRFFERVADPDWEGEAPCGQGEYSALEARLPDGTIIPLED